MIHCELSHFYINLMFCMLVNISTFSKGSKVTVREHFWKCLFRIANETSSLYKNPKAHNVSTAVCVLFLIKLRCPKNKSLYDIIFDYLQEQQSSNNKKGQTKLHGTGIHFPEKKGSFNLWSIRWGQYCPVSRARNSNKRRLNNIRITISNKFTFHFCKIFCARCFKIKFHFIVTQLLSRL